MQNLDLKVFIGISKLQQYLLEFFRGCYANNEGFMAMAEKYFSANERTKLLNWLENP